MAALPPVREALRQVTKQSWILGDRMSISRQLERSPDVPSWSDGNGCFFEITKVGINPNHSLLRVILIRLVGSRAAAMSLVMTRMVLPTPSPWSTMPATYTQSGKLELPS